MAHMRGARAGGGMPWLWIGLAIGAVVLLALGLFLILAPEESVGLGKEAEVTEITANPDAYAGREVTVSAEVEEVFGPRLFMLSDPVVSANDVLVLEPAGQESFDVEAGEAVRASGTIRRFSTEELQQEFGGDLPSQLRSEFRQHTVLVADRLEWMPGES